MLAKQMIQNGNAAPAATPFLTDGMRGQQQKLLDLGVSLPNGLVYRPDFLSEEEEEILLVYLGNLPLEHARYRAEDSNEYRSKRRHVGFGWGYDREREAFIRGGPLPGFLLPIQNRIAKWLDIKPDRVVEALVNEYTPGSGIGWHRDRERFEHIIGISIGGWCTMRFRPLSSLNAPPWERKTAIVPVELEPRSAYIMQGNVRWEWQHSVAPTEVLRYSITFRTLPK